MLFFILACVAPFTGVASFSYLAPSSSPVAAVPMGPEVTVEDCIQQVMGYFAWGARIPSHESVVARALAETGADVLLNAEVTSRTFNAYVYSSSCAVVKGTPARLVSAIAGGM